LTIPESSGSLKEYYERLINYRKIKKVINGHLFIFIVEKTRNNSMHSCSISDIETIIEQIPVSDYADLKFIVLRQPKRKEELLSPTWGRLIYSYEFENEFYPAIILDAIDYSTMFKWSKKLSVESQKELERLINDGHEIINNGKNYIAEYKVENVRNTQLYRTFIHEIGHYVHYLEVVERPSKENEDEVEWEKRYNYYFSIPQIEKEKFAHKYTETIIGKLKKEKIIPFEPK
jgi:hypothetical protein